MDVWVEQELVECAFPDQRLKARLGKLFGDLGRRIGGTVPAACQDWAATKAAYRFFDNPQVDEGVILAGHFAATAARFAATPGTVLVLHDTTEFCFQRDDPGAIGHVCRVKAWRTTHTVRGLLMHASLVLTTGGVPLGLAAVKFWTRKKFKGTRALRNRANLTRIPIEKKESVRWVENLTRCANQLGDPPRCVHVGDREADIYELFCAAREAGTHFLVRTCVDRLVGRGSTTIWVASDAETRRVVAMVVGDRSEFTAQCLRDLLPTECRPVPAAPGRPAEGVSSFQGHQCAVRQRRDPHGRGVEAGPGVLGGVGPPGARHALPSRMVSLHRTRTLHVEAGQGLPRGGRVPRPVRPRPGLAGRRPTTTRRACERLYARGRSGGGGTSARPRDDICGVPPVTRQDHQHHPPQDAVHAAAGSADGRDANVATTGCSYERNELNEGRVAPLR